MTQPLTGNARVIGTWNDNLRVIARDGKSPIGVNAQFFVEVRDGYDALGTPRWKSIDYQDIDIEIIDSLCAIIWTLQEGSHP